MPPVQVAPIPKLAGVIEAIEYLDNFRPDQKALKLQRHQVLVFVRIANSGAPSVVTDYQVFLIKDGQEHELQKIYEPEAVEIFKDFRQPSVQRADPAQFLPELTATQHVATNGAVVGWLLALIPPEMRRIMPPPDVRVRFKDAFGKVYIADQPPDMKEGTNGQRYYIPGTRPDTVAPRGPKGK